MPRKLSYKTMSLEGLEHVPSLSGEWTWQTPISTHRWDTYKLRESQTAKTHTISYLRVNYKRDTFGGWEEDNRYQYYSRKAKYLAVNGPLEGSYITSNTPDYILYYTQFRDSNSSLPRKIMIHVDSMARKLGLLW